MAIMEGQANHRRDEVYRWATSNLLMDCMFKAYKFLEINNITNDG